MSSARSSSMLGGGNVLEARYGMTAGTVREDQIQIAVAEKTKISTAAVLAEQHEFVAGGFGRTWGCLASERMV